MNKDYINLLFNSKRKHRCKQYLNSNNNDSLQNCYLYNIALSKTFYYLLHTLELILKNTINNVLVVENQNWITSDSFLDDIEKRKIKDIIKKLKLPIEQISDNTILENLEFGFFTRLFDKRYEKKIWHKYMEDIFPNIDKVNKNRHILSKKIRKLKNLRNKIAHHEPIYYWDNLNEYHDEIIEFIGWINKDMKEFTLRYDDFNKINKPKTKEIK